jgi:CRISPR-associated protein Csb2
MSDYLGITIRFLQPTYHGRGESAAPEWPPSPLRLFQALVAASAARWNERLAVSTAVPALTWLQELPAPLIVACPATMSEAPTLFYVPENSADRQVKTWKDTDSTLFVKRSEKVVAPIHMNGDSVHYVFSVTQADPVHVDVLREAARSLTHLGWGIDLVTGHVQILSSSQVSLLDGERWLVRPGGPVRLRVPIAGTLADLMRKHTNFLNRLSNDVFQPVPPLRTFDVLSYRRIGAPDSRPVCVFNILKPDASGSRPFHPARRTRDIAAWARRAVSEVSEAAGWADFSQFVHGHAEDGVAPGHGRDSHRRLQYLPLPTINAKLNRVESIRRVMIAAPEGCEDRIDFIRRRLLGRELHWGDEVFGLLTLPTERDWVKEQYLQPSRTWSTVTPVILDGFNDHDGPKTQKLIRKALLHAGIETAVEFEFSAFGFRAGVEPANCYRRPEKLNGSTVHVRLRFSVPVTGPLAIGAGRFRGFGLLAAERGSD